MPQIARNKLALLILAPIILMFISLFLGRYTISPLTVCHALAAKLYPIATNLTDKEEVVIFIVRLPRSILALLVGAALSISGSAFQGIFRNPLVSPDILGVSSAAGFGAALALLLSGNSVNTLSIQAGAFVFGILGVFLAYFISRVYRATTSTTILVLSGIIISTLFNAFTSSIKLIADPYNKLPAITFWLMGSLAGVGWDQVRIAVLPIVLGCAGLLSISWRINLLSLGDREARSLGVSTELTKIFIIICATFVTATAVCVSGVVGWIGLVVPHISRMIVGPDHKVLLPASIAIGASFLLLVDLLARTATPTEIPLGILTAVIGAPFFAYLLRKTRGGWG